MDIKKYANPNYILKLIVILSLVFVLVWLYKRMTKDYKTSLENEPWLIYGTHNAKNSKIIKASTLRYPIDNKHGIEFSYSFWMYIDDWNAGFGSWKHIMHKGNQSGIPLQSPGFWLYPKENKMAININTYHSVKESCDIDNISLNKWMHIVMVLVNKRIDVYVNGVIRKSCELTGIPKLNFGDIHITQFGGFSGLLSQVRYFNYALPYYKIESILKQGPSKAPCADSNETPPYLASSYHTAPDMPNNYPNNESSSTIGASSNSCS
jgi:hypothetical protein